MLKYEIAYSEEFPATENDPDCVDMVKMAARDNGLPLAEAVAPYPWSEDFAYYTGSYRGCLFGLGSGVTQAALHNPDYDFPDTLIDTGVRMFENIYKNLLF
jgi:metal-dependent amidase/aminoacylase/carboxypeptidase family protein